MSEKMIGGRTRAEWEDELRDLTINTGRIELLNAAFAEPATKRSLIEELEERTNPPEEAVQNAELEVAFEMITVLRERVSKLENKIKEGE